MKSARRLLVRAVAAAVVLAATGLVAERTLDATWEFPLDRLTDRPRSTRVLANDGTELRVTAPGGERRLPLPLGEFAPSLVAAVIAAEDERFREHSGVDWIAVGRAALSNLVSGRVVSGASTLTMQLVRIAEPRPRHIGSKVVEAFRARQLERKLGKDELLELYLNLAPLGGGVAGFEAAARLWFATSAREVDVLQAATLAALLPAPSRRAPDRDPETLLASRDRILDRMVELGELDAARRDELRGRPLGAKRHAWPFEAPHFVDGVLAAARRIGGEEPPEALVTTLDPGIQRTVESIVAIAERIGDGIAVVVLERATGAIRAGVGGYDWRRSRVDAAMRRRDVGSSLKPFLYAIAISCGAAGRDSLLPDSRLSFDEFAPENFDSNYAGSVRLRDALVESKNVPAVALLERIGTKRFDDALRSLGLRLPRRGASLDAALGTAAFSPLELAEAWRRFADLGRELPEMDRRARREVLVMSAEDHPLPGLAADPAIAWKTGTSSGRRDAWTAGVTERFVVVVWRGNLRGAADDRLVGVRAAAPLFARIVAALPR